MSARADGGTPTTAPPPRGCLSASQNEVLGTHVSESTTVSPGYRVIKMQIPGPHSTDTGAVVRKDAFLGSLAPRQLLKLTKI